MKLLKSFSAGLALVVLLAGCSATKSGLTKQQIKSIKAVVAQQTPCKPCRISKDPSGYAWAHTKPEIFVLQSNPEGWQIVHRADTKWIPPVLKQ